MDSDSELPVIIVAAHDPQEQVLVERTLHRAGSHRPIGFCGSAAELFDLLRAACFASPSLDQVGSRLLLLNRHSPQADDMISWIRRHGLKGIRVVLPSRRDHLTRPETSACGADRCLRLPADETESGTELARLRP